jgi:hypothetical protein
MVGTIADYEFALFALVLFLSVENVDPVLRDGRLLVVCFGRCSLKT